MGLSGTALAGVSRSVAMKLTGHKTESVYKRYAIVSEGDLSEGLAKLATLHDRDQPNVMPALLSHEGAKHGQSSDDVLSPGPAPVSGSR